MNIYSYDELRPSLRMYRSREVSKSKNPNGTYHRVYVGEDWYRTSIGDICSDEWYEMAVKSITANGDDKLLLAIIDYVKDHCAWLKDDKQRKEYAVSCLIEGAYKTWQERGEFSFA